MTEPEERALPQTEHRNPLSTDLDLLEPREQLILFLSDQQKAFTAHEHAVTELLQVVDLAVEQRRRGGRLIYVGAGTSGRLGVLDAVECKPTFSASPEEVIGVIAGGEGALVSSVEEAEDRADFGAEEMRTLDVRPADLVLGITASGRTPFVRGALEESRRRGARTALLCCSSPPAAMTRHADVVLLLDTGPEILTGSTRLKAGTATKVALNAISTLVFVRTGKVYGNLMVDVQTTNAKLRDRARRIVAQALRVDEETAASLLERAGQRPKVAIVMGRLDVSAAEAERLLDEHGGHIREALRARGRT